MVVATFLQLRNQIRHPMKKQTAVEWIQHQVKQQGITHFFSLREILEQAKAMEREQIEDAWCDGNDSEPKEITGDYAEQYYKERYGG